MEPTTEPTNENIEMPIDVATSTEPTLEPNIEENVSDTDVNDTPEWNPSFTYKVRDEEKEMEEWVKPFVKDEDTLKRFQDFYTAKEGIGLAKQERDEWKGKYTTLEESLGTVNELVQKNDARGFIEALGLPKKMFIDYAINELKIQELPPEEQQKLHQERQKELAFNQLQMQNSELETRYQETVRVTRENELNNALTTEYSTQAQAYEARTGVPGSFRQLVVDRGIYHHHVSGIDIPVSQAIQEAIMIAGVNSGTTQTTQQPVAGTPTVQPQQEKKVLPNLQGTGGSPTKTTVRTLADVKALRKQKYGF